MAVPRNWQGALELSAAVEARPQKLSLKLSCVSFVMLRNGCQSFLKWSAMCRTLGEEYGSLWSALSWACQDTLVTRLVVLIESGHSTGILQCSAHWCPAAGRPQTLHSQSSQWQVSGSLLCQCSKNWSRFSCSTCLLVGV